MPERLNDRIRLTMGADTVTLWADELPAVEVEELQSRSLPGARGTELSDVDQRSYRVRKQSRDFRGWLLTAADGWAGAVLRVIRETDRHFVLEAGAQSTMRTVQ